MLWSNAEGSQSVAEGPQSVAEGPQSVAEGPRSGVERKLLAEGGNNPPAVKVELYGLKKWGVDWT